MKVNQIVLAATLLSGQLAAAENESPKYTNDTSSSLAFSPHVYPSPQGGRTQDDEWKEAYQKAREFVKDLSIPEMTNVTTGIGWMMGLCVGNTGDLPDKDFRGLCLQDGPLGVRFADLISGYPSSLAAGSTFNKSLIYKRSNAIAKEHKAKGIDVMLGPAVGPVGVKAQGGRNWEAFGSDPYLQGIAGAESVKGIQDTGVIATGKHYLMNEQEIDRNTISSNVNDRALHEIYAWPYQDMIHAGVGSIMCSYNLINNSYGCENSKLLNGVLKDEMGFQGFVMSDWEALRSGINSAISGADMNQPGGSLSIPNGTSHWGFNLTQSVANGTLPIARLSDMATRIMAAYYKVGVDKSREERKAKYGSDEPSFSSWTQDDKANMFAFVDQGPEIVVNKHIDARTKESYEAAYQVAVEAVTLLKNHNKTLPLDDKKLPRKISILGKAAAPDPEGPYPCDDLGCSNGALAGGWGSGQVMMPYQITPFEAINSRAVKAGSSVNYNFDPFASDKFMEAATYSDLNIIFALTDSGENYIDFDGNPGDRKNTTLWHGGDEIIEAALNVSSNNIIVISSVGPINMEKFIDHENCTAVLFTTPAGQDSGQAMSDVIFGDHNPSGRLPFTIAKNNDDYIPLVNTTETASNGFQQDDTYKDHDIFVDYRHFDYKNITPRFEFGYGLSYSNWTFSDLYLQPVHPPASEQLPKPDALSPVYDSGQTMPSDILDLVFPDGFKKVPLFIYPYLDNPEQSKSSGEQYPFPDGYSTLQKNESSPAGGYSGGNKALWNIAYRAVAHVTNNGPLAGQYVAQLYVGYPKSSKWPTPPRQLRGFEKVDLASGQPGQVQFDILTRDLTVWDVESQQWVVPRGTYTVYIGSSSRNLELQGTFDL